MVGHDSLHRRGASALSAASAYEIELAVSVTYAGFSVASPANVRFPPVADICRELEADEDEKGREGRLNSKRKPGDEKYAPE